jgi:hypothetical protein
LAFTNLFTNVSSILPSLESFPTIEQLLATAETHNMLVVWGEAVASRVREYDGTRSVSLFTRQIVAAFRGVGIDLPTLEQWISAIELRIALNVSDVIETEEDIVAIF